MNIFLSQIHDFTLLLKEVIPRPLLLFKNELFGQIDREKYNFEGLQNLLPCKQIGTKFTISTFCLEAQTRKCEKQKFHGTVLMTSLA